MPQPLLITRNPVGQPVRITDVGLDGTLSSPDGAKGVVVFAHGSGSSRFSPRNTAVAKELQRQRIATLLFDLLTEAEAEDRRKVFDIPLLAERLVVATKWTMDDETVGSLPIGFFGASTGAAAAMIAAADARREIAAVVSRGGRPDLAEDRLSEVQSPTLLIVGGLDEQVLALNRAALKHLRCEKSLEIVPGATHLFEEPGALDEVVRLAGRWFLDHFSRSTARPEGP